MNPRRFTVSTSSPTPTPTASPIRLSHLGSWCEFCADPILLVESDSPARSWLHLATLASACEPVLVAAVDRMREEFRQDEPGGDR
jgi:hypothetical protein